MKKSTLLTAIFFILFPLFVTGQYSLTHYIPASPWQYYNDANELIVTTTSATPVIITIQKSDGTLITNTVTSVVNVPLRYRFASVGVRANATNKIYTNQGLIVSSTVPIGVQVRNVISDDNTVGCAGGTTDPTCIGGSQDCSQKGNTTFTSMGDQAFGTSFTLGYYRNTALTGLGYCTIAGEPNFPIVYVVHAKNANTVVTYNISSTVTLNAGESFLFLATFGSKITATKDVCVLSSKRVDNTFGCGDGVINPVLPDILLGDKYIVYRSNGDSNYEKSSIIASAAGTTVTVQTYDGAGVLTTTTNYTLTNAGDSVLINNGIDAGNSTNVGTVSYITSTKPVIVFSGTAAKNGSFGGCEIDMITQAPLSGCAGSFDVQTKSFTRRDNSVLPYFGYVIIQSGSALITLNGANLETIPGVGARRQIGTTGFYLIDFTNVNLSNPTNLRFSATSRIGVAMVQSGGGYSMASFITGFTNAYPPVIISTIACPSGTTLTADNTLGATFFQWYLNGSPIAGATTSTYVTNVGGNYTVAGNFPTCGYSAVSTAVNVLPQPCIEICNNGIDDDLDGTIDNADVDCGGSPTCTGSSTPIFTENFGNGTAVFTAAAYPNSPGYTQLFATSNNTTFDPAANFYALSNVMNPNGYGNPGFSGLPAGKTRWHTGADHTGAANGYAFVVNASTNAGEFFRKSIINLCPGTRYSFSIWASNLLTPAAEIALGGSAGSSVNPDISVLIQNTTNATIAGIQTGPIVISSSLLWRNYTFTFTLPAGVTAVNLVLKNNALLGGIGNDLAIDDISYAICSPTATVSSNAPSPLCIGSAVTFSSTVASGYTTPVYQWQKSTNGGTTWSAITGATSATYVLSPVALTDTALYRLTVAESGNISNSNCVSTSSPITLTVTNCGGTNRNEILCGASLIITGPSGYGNYQWYQGTPGSGTAIAGANTRNVTVTSTGPYYVIATIASPSTTYTEVVNVVLFSGAATTNPVIPVADQIGNCLINNLPMPKIFLCGGNDTQLIQTGISNATSIIWEQLNEVSCVATTDENCPNLNIACTWNQVGTGQNYTVTAGGKYRIRIIYSNGCFVNYYFIVFQNLLTPTETHRDIICGTNGTITVNGVPNSGYEFSITSASTGYQTSNIFTIPTSGTYTVYIRQIPFGVGQCVFTIPNIPIVVRNFSVSLIGIQPKCYNDQGSIRAIVSGVLPQYTYTLTQGGTPVNNFGPSNLNDYTFPNLNSGIYTLTVTTPDGCTFTGQVTLLNPPLLTTSVTLTKPLTCDPGVITINPQGGTIPYTYTISGFAGTQTVPTVSITTPGNYNITVTDANNCTATKSINVAQTPQPVYTILPTNILCYGSSTGKIEFNVTNTNGYTLTYSINNGSTYFTNPLFTNLPAASYEVIIKYVLGTSTCFTAPFTVTLTQPTFALTASGGVSELAGCGAGGTGKVRITNPQGGTPGYTYSFDNGTTYNNYDEAYVAPGTYTLYVKDSNGCTYPMIVKLDPAPNPPTISVATPVFNCDGSANSTVTVNNNAGNFAYTYFLDNIQNTTATPNVFSNIPCGPHTIKVGYENLTIPTYSNLLNEDFGSGANTTTPGISSNYCFNNQPYPAGSPCGNAVAGFSTPAACGSYYVDDNQYVVTSALNPNICVWFDYRDHTSNGTNPNGRFLAVNIGSAAGAYGILYSKPIVGVIPNQPVKVELYLANLLRAGANLADPDFILELVNASGTVVATQNTGIIDNITDGWQFKQITLNPGANTSLTFVIRSGSTEYVGNDAAIDDIKVYQLPFACVTETSFPITVDCGKAFAAQITSFSNVTCAGANNGSVTIAAQNFNATYGFDYSTNGGSTWTNSLTSPVTITNLSPSTYAIQIRYDNTSGSCTFPYNQPITTASSLITSASQTAPATCATGGTITASAIGGTPNYVYQLVTSPGNAVVAAYQSSGVFNNVSPGTYLVFAQDANLCSDPINSSITVAAPTIPVASVTLTTCYTAATGATITVNVVGGVGPYKYKLNAGAFVNSNIFTSLTPATYTIIVRDSYGCSSLPITQVIAPELVAQAVVARNLNCTLTPTAQIDVRILGGTSTYTYQTFYNATAATPLSAIGGTTAVTGSAFSYTTLNSGYYQFLITDSVGCTVKTATMQIVSKPILNAPGVTITQGILCNGAATAALSITTSGGLPPYIINVTRTSPTVNNYGTQTSGLTAGSYTITITDANSCTASTPITISEPNPITLTITKTDITCSALTGGVTTLGSITTNITAGSGTANYTYILSTTGQPNQTFGPTAVLSHTFSNLGFGFYSITVLDANGCSKVETPISVASPPNSLTINTTTLPTTCTGGGTIIVSVGSSGPLGGPFYFSIYQNLTPALPPYPTFPGASYQPADAGFPTRATFTGINIITGLPYITPGVTYTFIVYDASTNCYYFQTAATPAPTLSGITSSVTPTNVTCTGFANGNVSFTVSGYSGSSVNYQVFTAVNNTLVGAAGASTGLSGAPFTVSNFGNYPPGNYYILFTETSGCTQASANFTISESPSLLKVNVLLTKNDNCNNNAGQITATGQYGTPPYQYQFSPSPSTPPSTITWTGSTNNVFNANGGTYDVYIRDAFNCIQAVSLPTVLPTETTPSVSLASDLASLCNAQGNLCLRVTRINGLLDAPPFTYSIDGSTFTSYTEVANSFLLCNLNSGLHTVAVQDANGCSSSQTITLRAPLSGSAAPTIAPIANCGTSDGIITVAATGGSSSYSYSLNPVTAGVVLTGNVFSNVPQGNYTVLITDTTTLCTISIPVTIPNAVPVTLSLTDVITVSPTCNGGTNGNLTVTLAASNNDGPYIYTLTGTSPITPAVFNNSGSFIGLTANTYTVTVQSVRNCTATVTATIASTPAIIIGTTTVTQFNCTSATNGFNNATIQVGNVTGGSGTYLNYQFLNGTTQVQFGSSPTYTEGNFAGGSYTIKVFDSNGCVGTSVAVINQFIAINTIGVTATTPIACGSTESVRIDVTLTGGPATLSYTVSSLTIGNTYNVTQVAPNNTFSGLGIGNYNVRVTNLTTGCYLETTHYVNEPNTFDVTTTVLSNVTCYNGTNGSVSLLVTDLSPPNNAGAFSYSIIDTDTSVIITSGNSGSAGPYTVPFNLSAGTYQASITLAAPVFCTVVKNFTITQPATQLTIGSPTSTSVTCTNNKGTITVSAAGGEGSYVYTISPSPAGVVQTSPGTFSNLTAGSYTVTVTDSSLCTANSTVVVLSIPGAINASIAANPILLPCLINGAIATITVSGTSGGQGSNYLYTLQNITTGISSGPQASSIFLNNAAGQYNVKIEDAYNCKFITSNVTISQPLTSVQGTLIKLTAATCLNPAVLRITASGGTAPYTYSTSENGTYTSLPPGGLITVVPGTYLYYVKDGNNCPVAKTDQIIVATVVPPTVTVDTTNALISCTGGFATITATVVDGLTTFPYLYTLYNTGSNTIAQPQQTSATFNNIAAGNYYIRVNNGDCFDDSNSFVIIAPAPLLLVTKKSTNVLCTDQSDGTITVLVTGGTGQIQYSISSNPGLTQNNGTFSGLAPGNYTVFAQDQNGCTSLTQLFPLPTISSIPFTITEPKTLIASSIITQPACIDDKGMIVVSPSDGTITSTVGYTIKVGAQTQTILSGSATFSNLLAGIYAIEVTDANGCLFQDSKTIVAGADMKQNYNTESLCINNIPTNITTIYVNPAIPTTEFSYSLDGGTPTNQTVYTNLSAGLHTVKVIHTNPVAPFLICERTLSFFTTLFTGPNLTVVESGLNTLTATTTNGLPPYNYTINGIDVGTNNIYQINQSGIYNVVVIDSRGCSANFSLPMKFYDIVIPNFFTPDGTGINNTWSPLYTDNFPNIRTEIFDRYGRTIKMLLLGQSWDGKYNGLELPTGDYWYVLKLNDTDDPREFVGNFTLYR